jgi:hypothetical protein
LLISFRRFSFFISLILFLFRRRFSLFSLICCHHTTPLNIISFSFAAAACCFSPPVLFFRHYFAVYSLNILPLAASLFAIDILPPLPFRHAAFFRAITLRLIIADAADFTLILPPCCRCRCHFAADACCFTMLLP